MNLADVKPGVMYVHKPSGLIVNFVAADLEDGASLIVEERGDFGDRDEPDSLFRCESCDLEPATRADYEAVYPRSEECHDFASVGGTEA